ncbi:MAG: RagB/SusD family nutrient uptake outer membrane protein [Bacteroides sp.]|nr:RagB/SusD family nutrient uptake outer membrane protein [Bacteroides sp.]
MKINNLYKGMAALLTAASLASCSSDYLQLDPITIVDETTVMHSTKNAQLALYGICRSMYMGYSVGSDVQFLNGEPWYNTFYGEVFAEDAFYYLWGQRGGVFLRGDNLMVSDYWFPQMAYMYPYNLISQANKILQYIDDAEGSEAERSFIKAQTLTMRAHGYIKLLQLFAPRWEDSNNGAKMTNIVLRTEFSTGDAPLADMNTVLKLVCDDLDEAIRLYGESGLKRTYRYEPDIEVARGLYARTAMIKHDWSTAREMAKAARANYPVMTAEEYMDGFSEPTGEWMWCNALDEEDSYMGYFSWGALYACNGAYVYTWGFGSGAINYDTYLHMDENDTRRALYWTPDKPLMRPLTKASFWNSAYVDAATMNMNLTNEVGQPNLMSTLINGYSANRMPGNDISRFDIKAYCNSGNESATITGIVPFGAQYKFWGQGAYSNSTYPFMRGSEMALIEAEAAYMDQDEAAAKAALTEVNKNRITDYVCSTSGDALLDEIRWSRRIELWGEGFNFSDLKRWNMPMVRRAWVEGDVTSNNIPANLATTVLPSEHDGWTIVVPATEYEYNADITK